MPLQATSGAASYDAFGGGKAVVPQYIEDVFSTWLYTGTNTTLPVVNGIDLSTKGGMIWTKSRSNVTNNAIYDTARGVNYVLRTNTTVGSTDTTGDLTSFNTNGYTIGTPTATNDLNANSSYTFASWTFRKQPKFFDVVTYVSNGSTSQSIAHNLGSVPGCVIIKSTSNADNWATWHRSLAANQNLFLNVTDGSAGVTNGLTASSTAFTPSTDSAVSGRTYVAYIFAHNAGGFGLTGTDNVISCGSTAGSKVTLGWEPQWILYKSSNFVEDWQVVDNMRGLPVGAVAQLLKPNTSGADTTTSNSITIAADGFTLGAITGTAIYIAIRRGPMKVPTDGTKVFSPLAFNNAQGTQNTTGFAVDSQWLNYRPGTAINTVFNDRLRGVSTTSTSTGRYLSSASTAAESTANNTTQGWNNTGFQTPDYFAVSNSVYYNFLRAPSFFDEVCYTGTGTARTVAHNLGVAPELMIIKARTGAYFWPVWSSAFPITQRLQLESGNALGTQDLFNSTVPTSTVFSLSAAAGVSPVNQNPSSGSIDYVAYLFATCAGVSKVGSFVLSGSDQTINCGFTAGARFVLIKDTGTTGRNWRVWDTARGINSGATEPFLDLNVTTAEVTIRDWIEPHATGFTIKAALAGSEGGIGQTFIFLAIA